MKLETGTVRKLEMVTENGETKTGMGRKVMMVTEMDMGTETLDKDRP